MCTEEVMHLTQELELYPEYSITQLLFNDVRNAAEMRRRAVEGDIKCALINPTMLLNPLQVLVAANKAVHSQKTGKMKTRGLYSEIIFNLSPGNNISEAFKRFGVRDSDDSVHVTVVHSKEEESRDRLLSDIVAKVDGRQLPVDHVSTLSDLEEIRKTYKVTAQEERCGTLLDAVICRMATKDAL